MIAVEVRLYAGLHHFAGREGLGRPFCVEVPPGTSLAELRDTLQVPASEVKTVFVNHRPRDDDYTLQDGDRVAFFPPVAGG